MPFVPPPPPQQPAIVEQARPAHRLQQRLDVYALPASEVKTMLPEQVAMYDTVNHMTPEQRDQALDRMSESDRGWAMTVLSPTQLDDYDGWRDWQDMLKLADSIANSHPGDSLAPSPLVEYLGSYRTRPLGTLDPLLQTLDVLQVLSVRNSLEFLPAETRPMASRLARDIDRSVADWDAIGTARGAPSLKERARIVNDYVNSALPYAYDKAAAAYEGGATFYAGIHAAAHWIDSDDQVDMGRGIVCVDAARQKGRMLNDVGMDPRQHFTVMLAIHYVGHGAHKPKDDFHAVEYVAPDKPGEDGLVLDLDGVHPASEYFSRHPGPDGSRNIPVAAIGADGVNFFTYDPALKKPPLPAVYQNLTGYQYSQPPGPSRDILVIKAPSARSEEAPQARASAPRLP